MSLDQIWHSSLHIQTLMEYQKQSKQTYVFLNASSPKDGKLSKPQESPTPLKNHLKQFQKKLMLKYFPRHLTCLLQPQKQKLGSQNVQKLKWNQFVWLWNQFKYFYFDYTFIGVYISYMKCIHDSVCKVGKKYLCSLGYEWTYIVNRYDGQNCVWRPCPCPKCDFMY